MDTRIREYFDKNREALLRDITDIVAVQSVKGEAEEGAPYGAGPRQALRRALEIAESYGLCGEILGDRVLVIELGEGEPELGILAHLDVVPPAGEWRMTEPYKVREEGGVLYGRGVIDDKGPAMAALHALICARDLGLVRRKVQLILGSDEECGSDDIAWYQRHYKMPPKVFTPDGSFPVVNTEKGKMDIVLTAPPARGGGLHVVSLSGGSVPNAVPAECSARLSDGTELREVGRAAHASLPDEGESAVTRMLSRLAAMEGDNFDVFRTLSAAFPHGDNHGRAFGAYCEDELTGSLTVNLGVIDYDAERGLRALVDMRIPVAGDGENIAGALRAKLGDIGVEVASLLPPHHTPEDSELVRGLIDIYEDVTGLEGKALSLGGLTYVHSIEGGVAFGAEFEGSDPHMHEPDERVRFEELILSGEMFAEAIARFCA